MIWIEMKHHSKQGSEQAKHIEARLVLKSKPEGEPTHKTNGKSNS
jgi:hypothetical protein